jgi:dipeptidyl aminopeptidase/acylaminoacyl peptidase
MMADALKAAGKPHQFTILAGEDHWLSRGETRVGMLNAVVGFLEAHNPPVDSSACERRRPPAI